MHVRGSAAFYMVAVAVIGFVALLAWLPETRGADLVERGHAPSAQGVDG